MTAIRILLALAALCLAPLCVAGRTQAQGEWALWTGCLLIQLNGDRYDLLAGAEKLPDVAQRDREILSGTWEITSRDQLLATIHSLLDHHANRMLIGWNYPRAVNLARLGYAAGYLRESEAWALIMPAASRLQQTF